MNNKGQTVFLGIVVAILLFLVGMVFINFISPEVANAQNETNYNLPGLSCGTAADPNLTVSDGTKLTCLATEIVTPYYIIAILSVAGGAITILFLRSRR